MQKSKTERPSLDEYFLELAKATATRSTCRHRDQGAVLVRNKRVIATGYNGAPPGADDCQQLGYCSKTMRLPCRAEGLHGESNAIASAAKMGVSTEGATIYCVYSPCMSCCNLLKSAGIVEVKFKDVYDRFPEGPQYLLDIGIKVSLLKETPND